MTVIDRPVISNVQGDEEFGFQQSGTKEKWVRILSKCKNEALKKKR